jgi:hypothetical protein
VLSRPDVVGHTQPASSELAQACAGYRAWDGRHSVFTARDDAGRWQVFDLGGGRLTLVETLTGHDDRLHQAEALARDYASQQAAYSSGRRRADPLPRPHVVAFAAPA